MDFTYNGLPSITYWTKPLETAAVFVPVLATMLAISVYSLITGNGIYFSRCYTQCSAIVVSSSCLLLLLVISASKTYTHLMIKLSKLPEDPSSDPLHKVLLIQIQCEYEDFSFSCILWI